MGRILYLQFTDPVAYPPLEHSSRLLAQAGWQVRFIGTSGFGTQALAFPPHRDISVTKLPFVAPGWRQKWNYARFCALAVRAAVRWRPHWVYASEALSAPACLLVARASSARLLYHEHDVPESQRSSPAATAWIAARRALARRADLCVAPSQRRAERLADDTGRARPIHVVWNCPRRDEVGPPRRAAPDGGLHAVYHGAITEALVPRTLIEALAELPPTVRLTVIGYETPGSVGYGNELVRIARSCGAGDRLALLGPTPRFRLLELGRGFDVGICLMPTEAQGPNFDGMVGASNKIFDYLAGGLPVLVTDAPDWTRTFVEPGMALACRPDDARSIAAALRSLLVDAERRVAMGERGRSMVLERWNYDAQFAPVLDALQGSLTARGT